MSIIVRNMNVDDAKEVARIHTDSWKETYKGIVPQDFLDSLDVNKRAENWARGIQEEPSLIRLVAIFQNEVVGFVCGLNNRDNNNSSIQGELWAIYVDPRKCNRGIGKNLFSEFISKIKERNIHTIAVWVLEDNQNARKFYEKMGGKLAPYQKEIQIGGKSLVEKCYEYVCV
jgi:ribosomal protein S18 acetylase RimI-like enzyme